MPAPSHLCILLCCRHFREGHERGPLRYHPVKMKLSFPSHRFEVSASCHGGVPQRLPGADGRQGVLRRPFSGPLRPHNCARRRRGEALSIAASSPFASTGRTSELLGNRPDRSRWTATLLFRAWPAW